MAGMTAKHKKDKVTYSFKGDLRECIQKAEQELKTKENSNEWLFLKWQHDKAKKALDTYNARVKDLKGFIELGKQELKKEQEASE